jgi:hypothetical protein
VNELADSKYNTSNTFPATLKIKELRLIRPSITKAMVYIKPVIPEKWFPFLNLPIEIIDQILKELPRGDRLKILLRLAKHCSKSLGHSRWWREELQLDLGIINFDLGDLQFDLRPKPTLPHSEQSERDWQKLYHLYREGWSITTKDTSSIARNHRSLDADAINRICGDTVLLTDG